MRPEWNYLGDRAARVPGLTLDQVSYAITLRRVLAHSYASRASRRAIGDLTPAGSEWTAIAAACRREERRMERAQARLAAARGAA
jgi:hypothetical protein